MQIKGKEGKKCRTSSFIKGARLASGFILAPTLGALVFYLMLSVPLFFGYKLPGKSLLISPEFLIGSTLMAGSIFYAPAVAVGLSIMMFIRRYYSWSLSNCIMGGVLSAFAVSSIFLALLTAIGQGLMVAGAGFSMIMTLIIVPSMLSGISFWLIAVYKNSDIGHVADSYDNSLVQPYAAAESTIAVNSLNNLSGANLVKVLAREDKTHVE